MCGGRGSRLDAPVEKPLLSVGGRPMVDRVTDALAASRVDATYAVVSPLAPGTREHVDLPTLATPGAGYVEDLRSALRFVDPPVLTVAVDLPLLAAEVVDAVLDAHAAAAAERDASGTDPSLAVCVPAALKRALGASTDETKPVDGREVAPAGVNVVADGPDAVHVSHDARLAVNVNRAADVDLAEALL